MGPLGLGGGRVCVTGDKGPAARFLLYQHPEVELQHIHTSLQSQHGREEGGLLPNLPHERLFALTYLFS